MKGLWNQFLQRQRVSYGNSHLEKSPKDEGGVYDADDVDLILQAVEGLLIEFSHAQAGHGLDGYIAWIKSHQGKYRRMVEAKDTEIVRLTEERDEAVNLLEPLGAVANLIQQSPPEEGSGEIWVWVQTRSRGKPEGINLRDAYAARDFLSCLAAKREGGE